MEQPEPHGNDTPPEKSATPMPPSSPPPTEPVKRAAPPTPPLSKHTSSDSGRFRWILVAVILVGTAAGGYYLYAMRDIPDSSELIEQTSPLMESEVIAIEHPEVESYEQVDPSELIPEKEVQSASGTEASDADTEPDEKTSDLDDDGILDYIEKRLGTNPGNADSDGDGVSDIDEVSSGSDPLT